MKSSEVLTKARQQSENIVSVFCAEFQSLKEEQLNWKPEEKKWSIIECVEHLNLALKDYLPKMEAGIKNSASSASEYFKSGYFGGMMIKKMAPTPDKQIKAKSKTLKKTTPDASNLDTKKIFAEYIENHKKFRQLLSDAESVNLNKVKVSSLAGSILRFKLGDAFLFLMAHEERHLLQAQNVFRKLPFS